MGTLGLRLAMMMMMMMMMMIIAVIAIALYLTDKVSTPSFTRLKEMYAVKPEK